MTQKELFTKALKREPIVGHVPHFELVFFLTMEAVGRIHPCHRNYAQWYQMSRAERKLHLKDMALSYIEVAQKYNHSAIFVHPNPSPIGELPNDIEATREILETIRDLSGDEYFLMIHGDPTYPIPTGDTMMEFSAQLYDEPELIHEGTKKRLDFSMKLCDEMAKHKGLLDGWALCSDYCFNINPFYTREMFAEFIQPYLAQVIAYYHENGLYSIKHTDGNVMPILDMIVDCKPDAVHSLDPQGGVSLAEAKRLYGNKVCLIGNVNCGLMQTGTEEELIADTRRALKEGMPGYGYIFSTSNCAYTGLDLQRYELMHRIWKEEGVYC
ncbi:MAG: uroporphyrinogen decarboxylase family protein [Clostridia bacterium]